MDFPLRIVRGCMCYNTIYITEDVNFNRIYLVKSQNIVSFAVNLN